MATRLQHALKREVDVGGALYTLTIDPHGLRLVPKGRRKGHELAWSALVGGEAALAAALNASLRRAGTARNEADRARPPEPARPRRRYATRDRKRS